MSRWLAVDTETTGLSTFHGDRPFCISWCWDDMTTGFIRWEVDPTTRKVHVVKDTAYYRIKSILENKSYIKVFHNSEFDIRMLASIGINVAGRFEDTLYAIFCVKNDLPSYKLKYLGEKLLDVSKQDEDELKADTRRARLHNKKLGWKLAEDSAADYWMANPILLKKYSILDAIRTAKLWMFSDGMLNERNVRAVYEKEMKLWHVTHAMVSRGINIHRDIVEKEIVHYNNLYNKLYRQFSKMVGREVNINSPAQISKLFYSDMKIPDPTGEGSVNAATLALIKHPAVHLYERCRAALHANSSFFENYKRMMVKEGDGYALHPKFTQIGPVTGRYSCKQPNIQQASNSKTTKSVVPVQARGPFGPRPGYVWYAFDYSQIEAKMFAYISGDKSMLNDISDDKDVMIVIANHIWGHGKDIVASEKARGVTTTRGKAKSMMYGKIYGMGKGKAADLIGCTVSEARVFLDEFDKLYPGIKRYMDNLSTEGEVKGYITNKFGRRLCIDRHFSYRAVNYMIQSTAADMLKTAMINVHDYLTKRKLDAHIIMTIHDELIFEIGIKTATRSLLTNIKRIMEDTHGVFPVDRFKVAIAKIDTTWDNKYEIGKDGEYEY